MMKTEEIKSLFETYSKTYDLERHRQLWFNHANTFREFWKTKIMTGGTASPAIDYDPIIKLIDSRARGFNKAIDEAIARVNLPQGTWYRIFNDFRKEKVIRTIVDRIFKSETENELVKLINELN